MGTRAVLLSAGTAPQTIAREVARLATYWDEVIVAVEEAEPGLPPLATRWSAVRAALVPLASCWVTPLVGTPGLPRPSDRYAALEARLGRIDLLVAEPSLLEAAAPLGLNVQALTAPVTEPLPPIAAVRRALVVTRAQPFHRGHLALVERGLALRDEVVLVVAAAERALSARDPFTAGERLSLVRAGLGALSPRVWLAALPAPTWPAAALRQLHYWTPDFDLVVGHNPVLRALAEQHGLSVEGLGQPVQAGGLKLAARQVRARLCEEGAGAWLAAYLPAGTAKLLEQTPALAARCAQIHDAGR